MAEAEGWTHQDYALAVAAAIANTDIALDVSRERLLSLAAIGSNLKAAQASADTLAQHVLVLDALFSRFAFESHAALSRNANSKTPETAERYLNAAIRASRASIATMSALKILRDDTPTTTEPEAAALFLAEAK